MQSDSNKQQSQENWNRSETIFTDDIAVYLEKYKTENTNIIFRNSVKVTEY